MKTKFVVKDFESQLYYAGEYYAFSDTALYAEYFDTFEEAENFIKSQNGKFIIETVYLV